MTFEIRQMTASDVPSLVHVIGQQSGRHDEPDYVEKCLKEQEAGRRTVFIAFDDGVPAGIAQLNWEPAYTPFRRLGIPEIQDLSVVPVFQRRGIGARLVERCEEEARNRGKTSIGIGVGLYSSYGAAQRLYIKKGYVADGAGITYDNIPVRSGEIRPVDDLLSLKMIKALG